MSMMGLAASPGTEVDRDIRSAMLAALVHTNILAAQTNTTLVTSLHPLSADVLSQHELCMDISSVPH